tara:strand:+ start:2153 stop:2842 length:690 start_codon:yes stop_codon:yes gene_type:complete
MKTVAIIIAAGDATRWGGYGGTRKHFAKIDGEPIIHRTVRLLNQYEDVEVFVVGTDDEYDIPGSTLYVPTKDTDNNFDADKFLNSRELWNKDGRTIVIYGDVFFTEEAMEKLMGKHEVDWRLYARPFGSEYTGTPYGECFAQSFYQHNIPEHHAALRKIVKLYGEGTLPRCGGWEHYRAMIHIPDSEMHRHLVGEKLEIIDDFTDDIDFADDYIRLLDRWNKHNGKEML